jgi:hypothetical protein
MESRGSEGCALYSVWRERGGLEGCATVAVGRDAVGARVLSGYYIHDRVLGSVGFL